MYALFLFLSHLKGEWETISIASTEYGDSKRILKQN